jgi:hypothetical protein
MNIEPGEPFQQRALGQQLLDRGFLARMVRDPFDADAHPELELGRFNAGQASPRHQLQLGPADGEAGIGRKHVVADVRGRKQQQETLWWRELDADAVGWPSMPAGLAVAVAVLGCWWLWFGGVEDGLQSFSWKRNLGGLHRTGRQGADMPYPASPRLSELWAEAAGEARLLRAGIPWQPLAGCRGLVGEEGRGELPCKKTSLE